MPELICEHCTTPNAVLSEYLVFCRGCGKRLNGTFVEWKKTHPEGAFTAYLDELHARNEQQVKHSAAHSSRKKRSMGYAALVTVLLALAVLGGVSYFRGGIFNRHEGLRATPAEVLKMPWKRYTCGRFGLSVELPGKLQQVTTAADQGSETESYAYHPEQGFQVELISVQSKNQVADLEAAVNEAIGKITQQPGIAGVRYHAFPVTAGDLPGLLIRGTLSREGAGEVFYCAVFVKSLNVWQVYLRHLQGDATGADAAERILDSVEINYFGTKA